MGHEVTLLAAFIAGVVSFLSPCVLPLVPGYLSFISGMSLEQLRAERRERSVSRVIVVNTVAFVVGFSLVFVAMGMIVSVAAGSVATSLQRWLRWIGGGLIVVFGLHLIGVFQLKFLYQERRFEGPDVARGPGGALLLGMAFAAGWTPCIGPILSGILAIAATEGEMWTGGGLLSVYSAGLGIPFLLTGMATNRVLDLLDRTKRFLRVIEIAGGVLLVVVGIMIITNYFARLSQMFTSLNDLVIWLEITLTR